MCGYAVKKMGLAGGIVVTASHNPKEYNGYKVYGPEATQINTPVDGLIASEILIIADQTEAPTLKDLQHCKNDGQISTFGDEMLSSYIKDVQALNTFATKPIGGDEAPITVAYSPLHGVGAASIQRLSTEVVGLTEGKDFWTVEEQRKPDGAFPTLEFPSEYRITEKLIDTCTSSHRHKLSCCRSRRAVNARNGS